MGSSPGKKRSASLVVIKGRRRIGKSRLTDEFARQLPRYKSLHFQGLPPTAKLTAEQEREDFAQQFARQYRAALRSDSVRLTDSLAYQIVRTADHYGVERRVAFGLVWTESRFKVDARGKVGDVGLAQVLPSTGRRVCGIRTVRELYEPGRNLDCGFKFYAQLLERYGAVDWLALVAYNRGPRIADSIRAQGHTRSPSTTPRRN